MAKKTPPLSGVPEGTHSGPAVRKDPAAMSPVNVDLEATLRRAEAGDGRAGLMQQYGCGPIAFTGTDDALYERHLVFDDVIPLADAGPRERYEAVARSVRDVLSQRWAGTEQTYA